MNDDEYAETVTEDAQSCCCHAETCDHAPCDSCSEVYPLCRLEDGFCVACANDDDD